MSKRNPARPFPDLALRARIAGRQQSAVPGEGLTIGQVVLLPLQPRGMDEDAFIEHLRSGCADCRRSVAERARLGEKISMRVLEAAGVEVLN